MSLDDQLAQLWAAGATLSQIERSAGVSRGVAIGRIHRARKAGDVRFQPRSPNPKAPVKARRLKPFGETIGNRVPPPPPPKPPEPRPVPFLALRPGRCSFPLNSPARGRLCLEMVCCGEPVVRSGASYCTRHEALSLARARA